MSNKYPNYKRPDSPENSSVIFEKRLLPSNYPNRSGKKQTPKYIVIHEVSLGLGRSPESYNMEHYANKIFQDGANGRTIGYHFLVGDKTIYQFIEDDEIAEHTNTTQGNSESIGIERLICEGVNYEYALHNQAKLVATLMVKWNIPISNVVTHKRIQQIFTPNNKNYELNIRGEYSKISTQDLMNEYNTLVQMYNQIISNFSDFSENYEELETTKKSLITQFNSLKEIFDKISNKLEKLTDIQREILIYDIIKLQREIKKFNCKASNQEYVPEEKTIGTLIFRDEIVYKNCPSRLLAGQRGGLEKFYREVKKCLKHGWFFDEVLESNRGQTPPTK